MSGTMQRRGTIASIYLPPFNTLSHGQRTDAGQSFTMPFPTLRGGEVIVMMLFTASYGGFGTIGATATISGRTFTNSSVNPAAPSNGAGGASAAYFNQHGVAGDTSIIVSTADPSDVNHYFGAVAIIINSNSYSSSPNVGTDISFNNSNPGTVAGTFPTSPANGVAVCAMYAATTGNVPSGTGPTFTSTVDSQTSLLIGGTNTNFGCRIGVSKSTATFTTAAGAPANREEGVVITYNHL